MLYKKTQAKSAPAEGGDEHRENYMMGQRPCKEKAANGRKCSAGQVKHGEINMAELHPFNKYIKNRHAQRNACV